MSNTRIIIQNANNHETVYASVRLNRAQYLALREYMHTEQGSDVKFPYGSTLVKRGFGWYRVFSTNGIRGIDKVRFAVSIIKRFFAQFEESLYQAQIEETRRLLSLQVPVEQPIAYTHKGFTYLKPPEEPKPAPFNKLLALQAKFNSTSK